MRLDVIEDRVGVVALGRIHAEGAPLDPIRRAFMQSRFRRDFRDVRIHTGPWAAAAARMLGARAFTVGHHIVFADGMYAPASPETQRLLAHELVHVVQQGSAPARASEGVLRVGDPSDPLEYEAEQVADQILGTAPLAPITRAADGVIRRARVVPASTTLTVDRTGAIPALAVFDAEVGSQPSAGALCHLTRGANIADARIDASAGGRFGPAIRMTGTVEVTLEPAETLRDWRFGFIQFANLLVRSALWAGKRPVYGSVFANWAIPPAFRKNPSLDSQGATLPFTDNSDFTTKVLLSGPSGTRVRVEAAMGDHPNSRIPLRMDNVLTFADQFLVNSRLDLELTTVFVARNPFQEFEHLAHFSWHLIFDARFRWRGGAPIGNLADGRLDVGAVTLGPPVAANLQALLKTPAAPVYNDLVEVALAIQHSKPPNMNRHELWTPDVPDGFFL
jgi:hypothetical protein